MLFRLLPAKYGGARGADESSLEATPMTLAIDNILQKTELMMS